VFVDEVRGLTIPGHCAIEAAAFKPVGHDTAISSLGLQGIGELNFTVWHRAPFTQISKMSGVRM